MSEQGKVEQEGGEVQRVTLKADFSAFKAKLDWLSGILESPDIFGRIDEKITRRLGEIVQGADGKDEIAKLGLVTAGAAGEWIVNVEAGPLLVELESALRALGFEFHEGSLSS